MATKLSPKQIQVIRDNLSDIKAVLGAAIGMIESAESPTLLQIAHTLGWQSLRRTRAIGLLKQVVSTIPFLPTEEEAQALAKEED